MLYMVPQTQSVKDSATHSKTVYSTPLQQLTVLKAQSSASFSFSMPPRLCQGTVIHVVTSATYPTTITQQKTHLMLKHSTLVQIEAGVRQRTRHLLIRRVRIVFHILYCIYCIALHIALHCLNLLIRRVAFHKCPLAIKQHFGTSRNLTRGSG